LLAMYVGWWTLQEEERDFDHRDAGRHRVEPIRAEMLAGLERNAHNDVLG
jgi:hypothetical protein